MDDAACANFFRQPTDETHCRYEVLRAYFVDRRPIQELADRFGYRAGSLRTIISRFRQQYHADETPPFS